MGKLMFQHHWDALMMVIHLVTAESELGTTNWELAERLGLQFDRSYSSDSGRTIQTMGIILEELGLRKIPYRMDKRTGEWCFGSFDGAYDGDLLGWFVFLMWTMFISAVPCRTQMFGRGWYCWLRSRETQWSNQRRFETIAKEWKNK